MILLLVLTHCQKKDPHRASYFKPVEEESLPSFTPVIENEESASFDVMKLPEKFHHPISCYVTKRMPLKELMLRVTEHLKLPMRIDPAINASFSLQLKNEPFSHLIQTICNVKDVHCRYVKNVLCIEHDRIYTKTYSLSCLNISRKAQNNMRVATDVFSHDAKKESDASSSSVSIASKSDFWDELEKALAMMLPKDAFAFHRQAGLISVKGTHAQHEIVQRYLKRLRSMMAAQVLIEAKVVEVILHENYRSGIDWRNVAKDLNFSTDLGKISYGDPNIRDAVTMTAGTKTFSAILHALHSFGETETLASPSLRVLNNQSAVLKVAKNQVYFRLNYEKQYFTSRDQNSVVVSSDLHTVPIGLVLLVQPSIDMETGRIMLFLRPTLSRFQESVEDPAVRIMAAANAKNDSLEKPSSPVPVVDVREIDSVLCVQSGEMAMLGGLMDVRSQKDRSQIPGLADIPILGEAFINKGQSDHVVELVILLRATIMQK